MVNRDQKLLGNGLRKIQPKIRMFAKASDPVNRYRAEYSAAIVAESEGTEKQTQPRYADKVAKKELDTPKIKKLSDKVSVNTFVWHTTQGEDGPCRSGSLEVKKLRLNELSEIAENDQVSFLELGEILKQPDAIDSDTQPSVPNKSLRNIPGHDDGGRGVIIGIIDVGGFDFSHPDFLDEAGQTRWISIWDQSDKGLRPAPEGFDFGSEIKQEHMNAALDAQNSYNMPAWSLEEQSQMQTGSHATHVASIAAGNRGVARNAEIAGALVDMPSEYFEDHKKSFYDSTRVAQAVSYLVQLAESLNKPISINISLGTNGGGHDASNGASRWIDHLLSTPARTVCVAAGNAGQESPKTPGDMGYVMGRIHTSGTIASRGLTSDIDWLVVGDGVADVSENELEIWYSGADRFSVSITPPGMPTIGPIYPQQYLQNHKLNDGSMLSIYNELYHPANGSNYIAIYLSPFLKVAPVIGVRAGLWQVSLKGEEVRNGSYHGWIERDDPRRLGINGPKKYWNFPSFFTEESNVDNSSVSSLACGSRVISVANLDSLANRINPSSSQGPTRDGRLKPDVAAAGTDIVAANGFYGDGDSEWIAKSGTSMASPFVAGVAGIMLGVEPKLTSAQICGIIQRTSQPLPGKTYEWSNDCGFGVLNPTECVNEAKNMTNRERLEP